MTQILIADDHHIVRQGLKETLSARMVVTRFGEASNSKELLEQVKLGGWDLLILDVTMPGGSALDNLKQVMEMSPMLPILIFTMHPEEQFAARLLKSGASGYLTKNCDTEELVMAVQKVLSGKSYVSAALAETLLQEMRRDFEKAPHETLSNREYEVMRLIASGFGLSEIAKKLTLSAKTVSTYRSRILEKMSLHSNAEITHYVFKNHLLD